MTKTYTTLEAAEYLNIAAGTLRNMRVDGRAPRSAGVGETQGNPILYRRKDLDDWLRIRKLERSLAGFCWSQVPVSELNKVAKIVGIR